MYIYREVGVSLTITIPNLLPGLCCPTRGDQRPCQHQCYESRTGWRLFAAFSWPLGRLQRRQSVRFVMWTRCGLTVKTRPILQLRLPAPTPWLSTPPMTLLEPLLPPPTAFTALGGGLGHAGHGMWHDADIRKKSANFTESRFGLGGGWGAETYTIALYTLSTTWPAILICIRYH